MSDVVAFGERVQAAFRQSGHLCVGIDPHSFLLDDWHLADSPAGLREFGLRVVAAAAGRAALVKPQVAFFERHGSAGYAALEAVIAEARAAGLLVIADAKRGDVGTTVEAYGQAWLTPGSPLEADAMTISAYQGVGSIAAVQQLAIAAGKGIFVLAATSNPESFAPQQARIVAGDSAGKTVAGSIVEAVHQWNSREVDAGSLSVALPAMGSTGLVIGATVAMADYGIEAGSLVHSPILAPGFGHQGAQFSDVRALFGAASANVIVSASRSILTAGPNGIAAAIERQTAQISEAYSL